MKYCSLWDDGVYNFFNAADHPKVAIGEPRTSKMIPIAATTTAPTTSTNGKSLPAMYWPILSLTLIHLPKPISSPSLNLSFTIYLFISFLTSVLKNISPCKLKWRPWSHTGCCQIFIYLIFNAVYKNVSQGKWRPWPHAGLLSDRNTHDWRGSYNEPDTLWGRWHCWNANSVALLFTAI